MVSVVIIGLPWWLRWLRICLQCGRPGFDPWGGKIPWRRAWQPTLVFLLGESLGQRGLAGCSPSGRKESGMTEQLSMHNILLRSLVFLLITDSYFQILLESFIVVIIEVVVNG